MNSSQKGSTHGNVLTLPRPSPTGCEYYLMTPFTSGTTPEMDRYKKHLFALDPSLQLGANPTRMDILDEHQVVAIENLLKERNTRTEIDGEWVLSGLRTAVGSETFELIIRFHRFTDFVVPQGLDLASKTTETNRLSDPAEASADTTNTTEEEAGAEISGVDIQRLDSVGIDSNSESTVGPRSPTSTSDVGSGTTTPVPEVVRTEKERQIEELDALEEAICKCLGLLNGSLTAHSILKGVLEARKMLMGMKHLKTLTTMANLGFWYGQYGWHERGIALLREAVKGLRNLLGTQNEHTLTAMYKLADLECLSGSWEKASRIFGLVVDGRIEVLGKNHEVTFDTLKRLENIYISRGKADYDAQLPFLRELVEFQAKVRGENHPATLEAMDYLLYVLLNWKEKSWLREEAKDSLKYMLYRRIPALSEMGEEIDLFLEDASVIFRSNPFHYT
ncbi:hypothetical protein RUND412_008177 [Rhizina undulata]